MNKLVVGLLLGLVLGAGVASWVARPHAASEPSAAPAPRAEAVASNPLHLDASKRSAAGIVTTKPRQVQLPATVEAFGRVLDPTPYVTLVAEVATARAAEAASAKELERVRKLFAAGGNASAQAVETAEAAASRDRAARASAEVRLLAGWGAVLAGHTDLDQLRDALTRGAALVRIDLLPGAMLHGVPRTAQVALLGADDTEQAEILGAAPVADPQVQGESFLAMVRGHSLPAGATLRASVATGAAPVSVLTVPRAAVVYHQGSAWIYVLEKDTFERRRVVVGQAVRDDVAVEGQIGPGEDVASTGAQQLLSAELVSGTVPDER